MRDDIAIYLTNVKKTFKLPHEKQNSLKGALINFHKRGYEVQKVLDDVSFEIKKGEFFGIVGRNGSGKSTLLKLLAGIYTPDSGEIVVNGKLTPFIELGVGFNPELTGRENVFLNGALLGFGRNEMLAMYEDIVEFAELDRFMDQKLKNYSSGMQVRLAFSIAIRANTQILLLDEVLAVGDADFQKKCFDYFRQLKKDQQTVVFISHDMNAVKEYCDKAMLLDGGEIKSIGSPDDVAREYLLLFNKRRHASQTIDDTADRWGDGAVTSNKVDVLVSDQAVDITVSYVFKQPLREPIFGVSVFSPSGIKIYESNSMWKHLKSGAYKNGQHQTVRWRIPNIFTNGIHNVSVTAASDGGTVIHDWLDNAQEFLIDKEEVTTGIVLPQSTVELIKESP